MEVIALVGPSGTGKSHRALIVAHDCKVDTIIDDGLLIKGSKIVAGYSAKKELTRVGAIRRAIFMEYNHATDVYEAIVKIQPERILILGTSVNMIQKIIDALKLPPLIKLIKIEDIATKLEINRARESRIKEGKHVIPVPTIELKPHFLGYLIDPLEIFFKKSQNKQRRKLGEKSIVCPTFSYYGKLLISDAAIASMVNHVAIIDSQITRTNQIIIKYSRDKETGIAINLDVTVKYGFSICGIVRHAQQEIKSVIEYMTGMTVKEVNVAVKCLSID